MGRGKLKFSMFSHQAELCKAWSSTTRIMIMWLLADEEKSVNQLAESLNLSVPNISQHLRVMRDKVVVTTRKQDQHVYYRVSNQNCIQGLEFIWDGILEQRSEGIK